MNTGRLAEEGVTEFMFVLGQARLKGAVQILEKRICEEAPRRFRVLDLG